MAICEYAAIDIIINMHTYVFMFIDLSVFVRMCVCGILNSGVPAAAHHQLLPWLSAAAQRLTTNRNCPTSKRGCYSRPICSSGPRIQMVQSIIWLPKSLEFISYRAQTPYRKQWGKQRCADWDLCCTQTPSPLAATRLKLRLNPPPFGLHFHMRPQWKSPGILFEVKEKVFVTTKLVKPPIVDTSLAAKFMDWKLDPLDSVLDRDPTHRFSPHTPW